MIVIASTHVLVDNTCARYRLCSERRRPIESVLEDRFDMSIRTRRDRERVSARGLDTLVAIALREPEQPETRSVSVLGMTMLGQDRFCERRRLRTDGARPSEDARRRPLRMLLVRRRHVRSYRRVLELDVASRVCCDTRAPMKDLDARCRRPHPELFLDERVWGRVEVIVEHDVIIDVELPLLPRRILEHL